jgi:hypothetical protein
MAFLQPNDRAIQAAFMAGPIMFLCSGIIFMFLCSEMRQGCA